MAKTIKAQKPAGTKNAIDPRQQMLILGGIIVVALVMVGGFMLLNQQTAGTVKAVGESEIYDGIPIGGRYANVREVQRASDVAEGVERGMNEDGVPYIGDPDAAIIIGEIADFTCPHCANYAPTIEKLIQDFARSGDALFEFYPLPAQGRAPASTNAARAAVCADEQGAFWEMHDELFRIHLAESPGAYGSMARIEKAANDIGLDGSKLRDCMNSNTADAAIIATQRVAQEINADSTPTVFYRYRGESQWRTLITSGGQIGGGRPYDQLAELIRRANQEG